MESCFVTGIATGIEFCHAESPPMKDPTLWTFATSAHTDNFIMTTTAHTDNSIMTTTVCTILFFIFGVVCGLIAYCCVSMLWKRNFEQRGAAALHGRVNGRVMPNTQQMVFNRNIAYRQA